ncbi:hypothetical protein J3R83DRAFT_9393 [Lanmaoa asiatica]|nr:hypothetical protein J3R83DRAFT_9393 [Lanmaoa asiatica]
MPPTDPNTPTRACPSKGLPRGAQDLGDGFALLRKRDRYRYTPQSAQESLAIQTFLGPSHPIPLIKRWARLRLPNGQTARSFWRERLRVINKLRVSRNVSFTPATQGMTATRFGEVQYFTRLAYRCEDGTYAFHDVAIVKLYSDPQPVLLDNSQTVAACKLTMELSVIPVTSIHGVVTLIPRSFDIDGRIEERLCVLR